jgi:Outer membrane protein and related peptidoglycan-associated (lipo)proteins
MKKLIVFITIITLAIGSIFAQEQSKHEISVWGAYGFSTLVYDLNLDYPMTGDRNNGLGYLGGIGYNYYLNYHWSIGLGAELQAFTSSLNLDKFQDYNYLIGVSTGDGIPFGKASSNSLTQDYKVYYLNIPIQVKYQLDVWKTHKFYAAGNLKIGIPMNSKFDSEGDYAADWRINQVGQDWGLGKTTANLNEKGKAFDTRLNPALGLESGMKWDLGKSWALYTGLFVDFGLLDIRKEEPSDFVLDITKGELLAPLTAVGQNSVLNSRYTLNEEDGLSGNYPGGKTAFTNSVNTLAAGIKIQLSIGAGAKHAKKIKIVEEAPKPLSADEVDGIVAKNAQKLIDAQKAEFKNLKDFIDDKFKKEEAEIKEGLRLETVWGFDLDKTVIKSGTMDEIANRNLETLIKHPEIRVNLVGNTDDFASVAYNMDLGTRRAQAMKDWLVSRGIAASRLQISSQGKEKPFVPNSDEANRRYNRRVEFLIIK